MSKELLDELLKGCERPEDLCAKTVPNAAVRVEKARENGKTRCNYTLIGKYRPYDRGGSVVLVTSVQMLG